MAYNDGSDPTLAELITAKFVPDMFSAQTLMHTMSRLVCVQAFNTSFKDNLRIGSNVSIPVFNEATTTEVTPGTEPTAVDTAGTPATITIDKWHQAAAEISELAEIEELADYLKGASQTCGYAIQKAIDTDVGSLFSTLASSTPYGSDGQTFTDDIFKALVETLDENDIPSEDRVLIGDSSTKRDMLDIDKFIRIDYVNNKVVPSGLFGTIYDAKVLITNNLTATSVGNYGVYAHKDAIGVVIQKNPRSRVWDMGYKFITKVIVDAAWGADELRDTFGKAFYTRSK
jgi:hypothetical protein